MRKIFAKIHKLLSEEKYPKALSELMDDNLSIKFPYNSDVNHAWYIIGDIYYKLGNHELAIRAFTNALDDWNEDKDALIALSNSFSKSNKPKESEEVLLHALSIYPNEEILVYNLGNALFDQNKFLLAKKQFQRIKENKQILKLAKSNISEIEKRLKENE